MERNVIFSDLDGTMEAAPNVLEWNGYRVEIDLTEAQKKEVDDILEPYLSAGRMVGNSNGKPAKAPPVSEPVQRAAPSNGAPDNAAVRAWAKDQGIDVAPRGRLPRDLVERYLADANGGQVSPAPAVAPKAKKTSRGKERPSPQEIVDLARQSPTNAELATNLDVSINTARKWLADAEAELGVT